MVSPQGKTDSFTTRVALIVALGGFLMGFDASVISGVVKFIEAEFQLGKFALGWGVASLSLAATLAMLIAGPLAERFGRRRVLQWAAACFALSALASAIAGSFAMLVGARMIGGFGVGAALVIAPMYIAEIAPAAQRGRLVSFNQLNIVIGISAAFFSNYLILQAGESVSAAVDVLHLKEWNWRWMLGIEALPALLYLAFLKFVPESPRWLIAEGRTDEALAVMTRTSDPAQAKSELLAIQASLDAHTDADKPGFGALLQPALRPVLTIALIVAVLQQITGINAVFFYAPMIFEQSGIGSNAAFMQAILVGLTNLVFTVVAMVLIDRIGRKILLCVGVAGMAVGLFTISHGFHNASYSLSDTAVAALPAAIEKDKLQDMLEQQYANDTRFKAALSTSIGADTATKFESELIAAAINLDPKQILAGILMFVASFAASLGPVMWVLLSELFPNSVRALAIGFVGFVNSSVSFIVQLLFPWELAQLGAANTFFLFGCFAAAGLLLVMRYLPETKQKSLEELEHLLAAKV